MILKTKKTKIKINKKNPYLSFGYMFKKQVKKDEGILFTFDKEYKYNATIHMMFVFFPIRVYWLDSNYKIVDSILAKPFMIGYTPKKNAKYVLEVHPDVILKNGAKLNFENANNKLRSIKKKKIQ